MAKIYPDTTLSDFYLLKLSCKQSLTVDLVIDQNIAIGMVSYFYAFLNKGRRHKIK